MYPLGESNRNMSQEALDFLTSLSPVCSPRQGTPSYSAASGSFLSESAAAPSLSSHQVQVLKDPVLLPHHSALTLGILFLAASGSFLQAFQLLP